MDDELEPTKQKVDFKALPCVVQDEFNLPSLSPMLKKTQISWKTSPMIQNLSNCLSSTTQGALNSQIVSEWSNLITSRAIDLNWAGQYTISCDKRHTEKFGDLKFIVGSDKPTKTVDDHGKLVTTWDVTSQATLFVFPHRAPELTDYSIHIKSLFGVVSSFIHD